MEYSILKVENQKHAHQFLDVAREIYKNDSNWVCPLDFEIEGIFDPSKNKFFQHGEASRWILLDKNKKYLGRIAAFINENKVNQWEQATGGIGFFECVNNQIAANKLFDTTKKWLIERDIKAMDGPINFGENFNHWGLLVDGFSQQAYGMPYHHQYYKELFENYGFKVFFKQYTYHLDITIPFPERFWRIAERVVNKPDIECLHFNYANKKKFLNDLVEIYNDTWQTVKKDATAIDYKELDTMLSEAKDIIEEKFIWFVYKNNEPAAFFIMFPDVNQILKHLNGKLNFINKLKFAYYKWTKTITRSRVLVMGVKPQFQRMGLESAIFYQLKKVFDGMPHYNEIELSWVGDYNPRMIKLFENTGAKHKKTHITYRFLFDKNAKFERMPIPDSKLIKKK